MRAHANPIDIVDLGADVGTVSLGLHVRLPGRIASITALEPNPNSYPLLTVNLAPLPFPTTALEAAIGASTGRARIVSDAKSGSDHTGHIVPDENGEIPVTVLDDLVEPADRPLLVKIDVEGQERASIIGGRKALASRPCVIVLIEIHPTILKSTDSTPEEIMVEAEAIRPSTGGTPIRRIVGSTAHVPFSTSSIRNGRTTSSGFSTAG